MEGLNGVMVKTFAVVWLTVNCFGCFTPKG